MPQAKRKRPKRVKRVLNVVPSRETERDWGIATADAAGLLAGAPGAVPKSKDLRETWWKVGDQGSTGSCVGWATADSLLRWHFVKAGKIKNTETLSKRFIWMASKETDEFNSSPTTFIENAGTSLKAALDVARKFGAVKENVLPFAGGLYPNDPATFYALAAQLKISSYFNLSLNRGGTFDSWRRWLAAHGPMLTRLDVDRTWDDASDNAGNMDTYQPNTRRGGHAVSIIGYTADRFIVRNSWGTGWGDKGFAYASLDYAQDAFTEAYGISV
jgi:hypothetical protein